ncbi:MAG: lysozyme [Dokdonella sp.]
MGIAQRVVTGVVGTAVIAAAINIAEPLIIKSEGLRLQTYQDIVGVRTICFGHTGKDVKPGMVLDFTACRGLLGDDMVIALNSVLSCTRVPVTSWQLASLASFTLNLGGGRYCTSTMVKMINAGAPADVWCRQMMRFVMADGIKRRGLEIRRAEEMDICLHGAFAHVKAGSKSTAPPPISVGVQHGGTSDAPASTLHLLNVDQT